MNSPAPRTTDRTTGDPRADRNHPRRGTRRARRAALPLTAVLAATALALSACGTSDTADEAGATLSASGEPEKKGGIVLQQPREKPDLTLTDTEGKKYDLVKETKGQPTLLYFGYTNCPDACPLMMSNLAVAKSKLTREQQKKLKVVFVTSDPKRDTTKRLDKWLRMQDADFLGLTGDFDTIQAAAQSVNVALEPPYKKKNGDIVSTHGKELLVFSPKDDRGHVLYTEKDATPEVLEKDLPKLIKGQNP
ncbi:SCO family protein [Streptomyces sp. AJS327]|uniref:SCO family protein n=1 Tax=Streptomyces sp. AJS327 TaxID=2545265 RepID=UPI0015DEA1E9|nr:SCO family protein [Streptomyces sp. AJS327]MBA0052727.1 SCO family protein [Streptomyces sp. AJS327]